MDRERSPSIDDMLAASASDNENFADRVADKESLFRQLQLFTIKSDQLFPYEFSYLLTTYRQEIVMITSMDRLDVDSVAAQSQQNFLTEKSSLVERFISFDRTVILSKFFDILFQRADIPTAHHGLPAIVSPE